MSAWVAGIFGAVAGGAAAAIVARIRISQSPPALMRTNVSGVRVPAVLGEAVCAGALCGLGMATVAAAALGSPDVPGATGVALALVVAVIGGAGRADDLRGDEAERGFRGHVKAALNGRLTGGAIKIGAGGLGGLAAALIVDPGWGALPAGLIVALAANLFNLFDRAPGRAGKAWVLLGAPVMFWAPTAWGVAAAGMAGALGAVLVLDLRERGMLGDSGSNPLGAGLGLGLAMAASEPVRWGFVALLLVLNLISEKVSFSAVIDHTPLLRKLDRLGRA